MMSPGTRLQRAAADMAVGRKVPGGTCTLWADHSTPYGPGTARAMLETDGPGQVAVDGPTCRSWQSARRLKLTTARGPAPAPALPASLPAHPERQLQAVLAAQDGCAHQHEQQRGG